MRHLTNSFLKDLSDCISGAVKFRNDSNGVIHLRLMITYFEYSYHTFFAIPNIFTFSRNLIALRLWLRTIGYMSVVPLIVTF